MTMLKIPRDREFLGSYELMAFMKISTAQDEQAVRADVKDLFADHLDLDTQDFQFSFLK